MLGILFHLKRFCGTKCISRVVLFHENVLSYPKSSNHVTLFRKTDLDGTKSWPRNKYGDRCATPERVCTISRVQSSMLCPMSETLMSKIPVSDEPQVSVVAERHGHPRLCKQKGPSSAGKDERQLTFRRTPWPASVTIHRCRRQSVIIHSSA